jgi:hypothetical protein
MSQFVTRREFLKLSSSALALAALPPLSPPLGDQAGQRENRFGRVTIWRAGVHSEPDPQAPQVSERQYDALVNILNEVKGVGHYDHNPIWYRIADGYIYSSWVQPVMYRFNRPITQVEPPGLLAWVTVPYTDLRARPDPSLQRSYRVYYDAIFRVVDVQITPDEPFLQPPSAPPCPSDPLLADILQGKCAPTGDAGGADGGASKKSRQVWYGLRDGLTWGGVHGARAEHLRIIPPEELTPLSPEVEDKRILIELSKQQLTCFEGQDAVFATRLSSGLPGMVTPVGIHHVLQKTHTTRMIGGVGQNYYDLPGIGFTTYFTAKGVAIHGTYWHNDYGRRRSHGCVNTPTTAAQWVYRWTRPDVPYDQQRLIANKQDATVIEVVY